MKTTFLSYRFRVDWQRIVEFLVAPHARHQWKLCHLQHQKLSRRARNFQYYARTDVMALSLISYDSLK